MGALTKQRVLLLGTPGLAVAVVVAIALRSKPSQSSDATIPPKPSPIARYEGPLRNPAGDVVAHLYVATPWLDWGDVFWIVATTPESGDAPILLSGHLGSDEKLLDHVVWSSGDRILVDYYDASGRPLAAVVGPLAPMPGSLRVNADRDQPDGSNVQR